MKKYLLIVTAMLLFFACNNATDSKKNKIIDSIDVKHDSSIGNKNITIDSMYQSTVSSGVDSMRQ